MIHCWTSLIADTTIAAGVRKAGARITRDYAGAAGEGGELMLVGLLEGGLVFLADLARAIRLPLTLATMHTRSYGAERQSSGRVELVADLETDITGRDVIVVDDICDSGRTLAFVERHMAARQPRSVAFACLLIKDVDRAVPVNVRYGLFPGPNRFVVGYGLDLAGLGRGLPGIWALKPGVSDEAALAELRSEAFSGFKPDCVEAK